MEQSFLAWLRGRTRELNQVAIGIGDDAAVLDIPAGHQLVATTDAITDQVDFLIDRHSLCDIGFKSLAVNLSDLAAMGATPHAALVTLSLPGDDTTKIAAATYEGILEGAKRFGVAIAGGDITVYDGPLSISITMLGLIPRGKAWRRSGACEGDCLLVSGPVGGSLLRRHLRPEPRLDLVNLLQGQYDVHAAMDISDGLTLDLDRLCAASGAGIELDLANIPIHDDAHTLSASDSTRTALQRALGDGEDFELLIAMAPDEFARLEREVPNHSLHRIGDFVGRTGIWSRTSKDVKRISPSGFIHGARRATGATSESNASRGEKA